MSKMTQNWIEKKIELDNVSLVDFWGTDHKFIQTLEQAYPTAKIVVRGNQIKISGVYKDVESLNITIKALVQAYQKTQTLDPKTIAKIIKNPHESSLTSTSAVIYNIHGKPIKPQTATHVALIEAIGKYDLCFAVGPAGTGKTYMTVALAVRALKNKQIKKIVISRPVVEAGEHLGFLPGDINQKIDPYLQPIYDTLAELIPTEKLKYYLAEKIIDIIPLAYMRGRTFRHAFIILDEAQNTTPLQMKMFLTRLGEFSKVIVTGDISQTDLDSRQMSGLKQALSILRPLKNIKTIMFNPDDVMRHDLVKDIIKAYADSD